jgi:hypothetical protein
MKWITASLLCAAFGAAVAFATPARPHKSPAPTPPAAEGFGKARFGMSLEEVRRLYPALTSAPDNTRVAYFNSPLLSRFMLTEVKVPGLSERTDVEFRFWKNRLWMYVVYPRGSFGEAFEYLERRYGKPNVPGADPSWTLPSISIITTPAQMWYTVSDNAITPDVQAAFNAALRGMRAPPPRPPTAAAAPAPAR